MITIFVGTFNRISTLINTVLSYDKFVEPHEVVIVNNGTDDPGARAVLKMLRSRVKKVYDLPICNSMQDVTNNFNTAILDQFETDGGGWFAVTEADVSFDGTDKYALCAYVDLAIKLDTAVGPHLRADDIPAHYPLRSRVLACENWMQYRQDMESYGKTLYNKCQTDTTFHLFTRRPFFNRLHMNPVRVGPPYDAKHTDWYINPFRPTLENKILIPGLHPVGSWGKSWIRDYWQWCQDSPEYAFEMLSQQPKHPNDLCNVSFILSWCYQYGYGVERDLEMSLKLLRGAIPKHFDRYWNLEKDWVRMIYDNDFSALD